MDGPLMGTQAMVDEAIETEPELERLLNDLGRQLAEDVQRASGTADDLDAVLAWAAVTSHAVAKFYAPASPWPGKAAGWTKSVAGKLQAIATQLSTVLKNALGSVGANGFSIGATYPFGLSVALNW